MLDLERDLLLRLQSSVQVLGEKDAILKECFLDLGSFPEGRRIPASALIDIWTEVYEMEEDKAKCKLLGLHKMKMASVVTTRFKSFTLSELMFSLQSVLCFSNLKCFC